jgi:hypothetical protein
MSKYAHPAHNEWVQPVRKAYHMACCDCGLVHELDFRIERKHIQFRVRRHNRATGQIRRAMFKQGKIADASNDNTGELHLCAVLGPKSA